MDMEALLYGRSRGWAGSCACLRVPTFPVLPSAPGSTTVFAQDSARPAGARRRVVRYLSPTASVSLRHGVLESQCRCNSLPYR